ncbi:hemin uptake protein HemP [Sedimentitalea sp. JM2-8]|uniref:Hemin uptake protein HemP n=1 Tax=Sedimentitalea xiamensis TaxID=3050037 RepID=A0ABT7FGP3_9RHOB|nr:hemin uptake protein HemP [Sedimentitalea xiamensis]MDK3074248.1 hemin uptake protein HemP [Sedimentitalea xiamensis]
MTAQIPDRTPCTTPQPVVPRYAATDLTLGHNLAEIALGDQVYRLRITKAGKLILTK